MEESEDTHTAQLEQLSSDQLMEILKQPDRGEYTTEDLKTLEKILEERGFYLDRDKISPKKLTGIGGWLILPAISLVISPIFVLIGVINAFAVMENSYYEGYYQANIAMNLVGLFAMLFCAYLFFRKDVRTPPAFIGWAVLYILITIIDGILAIDAVGSAAEGAAVAGIIRSIIFAGIWIPYFLMSKRVKYTFKKSAAVMGWRRI